jgi:hypothetical protein
VTSGDGRAENQWRIEDSTFLRLLPGPTEEHDYLGGRMRLISLELYEEGALVTWHLHALPRSVYEEAARHPDVIADMERYAQHSTLPVMTMASYPERGIGVAPGATYRSTATLWFSRPTVAYQVCRGKQPGLRRGPVGCQLNV